MEQWDLSYNQLNIQAGEIAKGFGSSGGGMQWQKPLPLEMLIDLGLIKKI